MSDRYDIGFINDFGGGDTNWWADYLRAEVERANDFHADIHEQTAARITALEAENERLRKALTELHAVVWGECPSLLNEDSGGDARLDLEIRAALEAKP